MKLPPPLCSRVWKGSTLGIWSAHGEGKFAFPKEEAAYHIPARYHYEGYPANPNGSDYNAAMLSSADGRHLVMMPHLERATFPWNWGHYPAQREDAVSPWMMAFDNAFRWLSTNKIPFFTPPKCLFCMKRFYAAH